MAYSDQLRHLRVRNWEKLQYYKDRNPPWIKLYNTLLEDPNFARLDDASKAHVVLIWLLAPRMDNKIPHDAEFIGARINAKTPVNLDLLVSVGFLEDASEPLAPCLQDASPQARPGTRAETAGDLQAGDSKPPRKVKGRIPQATGPVDAAKLVSGKAPLPLFALAKEYAERKWSERFASKPTWGAKDFSQLARVLRRHRELTLPEFSGRWDRYIADRDEFIAKQGYSLAFFCSRFDAYVERDGLDVPYATPYQD
jgi:hypothetical protein